MAGRVKVFEKLAKIERHAFWEITHGSPRAPNSPDSCAVVGPGAAFRPPTSAKYLTIVSRA